MGNIRILTQVLLTLILGRMEEIWVRVCFKIVSI